MASWRNSFASVLSYGCGAIVVGSISANQRLSLLDREGLTLEDRYQVVLIGGEAK